MASARPAYFCTQLELPPARRRRRADLALEPGRSSDQSVAKCNTNVRTTRPTPRVERRGALRRSRCRPGHRLGRGPDTSVNQPDGHQRKSRTSHRRPARADGPKSPAPRRLIASRSDHPARPTIGRQACSHVTQCVGQPAPPASRRSPVYHIITVSAASAPKALGAADRRSTHRPSQGRRPGREAAGPCGCPSLGAIPAVFGLMPVPKRHTTC